MKSDAELTVECVKMFNENSYKLFIIPIKTKYMRKSFYRLQFDGHACVVNVNSI